MGERWLLRKTEKLRRDFVMSVDDDVSGIRSLIGLKEKADAKHVGGFCGDHAREGIFDDDTLG